MPRLFVLATALFAALTMKAGGAAAVPAAPPAEPCDSATVNRYIAQQQAELTDSVVGPSVAHMDVRIEDYYCGPNAPAVITNPDGRVLNTPAGPIDTRIRINVRELCKELQRQQAARPSGEGFFWNTRLTAYRMALREGARRLGWQLGARVHVVSVVAADPNARVVRFSGCDDQAVFFNRRFTLFAMGGRQQLGALMGIAADGRHLVAVDRESVLAATRDPAVQARYAGYARSILDVPDSTADTESEIVQAMSAGTEWFAMAHEFAHIARGHAGEMAGGPPHLRASSEEDVVDRWARELEADYYGTQLFVTALREESEDYALRFVRWTPLVLLTDLESHYHLQRLMDEPRAPPRWPDMQGEEAALREELRRLPRTPETDEFAGLLMGLDLRPWSRRSHPPEHIRAAVVRLALVRNQAITRQEYDGFAPADAWRLGIRTLYNSATPTLGAEFDRSR